MNAPGKWKLASIVLALALLCSLGFSAYQVYVNFFYKRKLEAVSQSAGMDRATVCYGRAWLRLYELDESNRSVPEFTGRREGPFEVWHLPYNASAPAPWRSSDRIYWQAYNDMMHYQFNHPARFRSGSLLVTNNVASQPSREPR
jgi:hypothetical protein